MPCFDTILKANKLTWIKRLVSKDNNFTSIAHANAHIDNFSSFFKYKMSPVHLKIKPTSFYTQIIEYWNELRNVGKLTCNEILNEPLWLNKDIIIGKHPVHYTVWEHHGICLLNDILKNDGSFKSCHDLFLQYNLKVDIMKYNSIKSSISRQWIKTIREANNTIFKAIEMGSIKIGNRYKKIEQIKCKEFYWQIISCNYERPTAIGKWEEQYYYANFNWEEIFRLPYITSRETSLQSLQYKIVNRFIACNSILGNWYKEQDKNCTRCNNEETIEHLFFECKTVLQFWLSFNSWWKDLHDCVITLGKLDIIFGIISNNQDEMLNALNYCILFAKSYIYKCKLDSIVLDFNDFIKRIKNRIEIEKQIAEMSCKLLPFHNRWNFLYK